MHPSTAQAVLCSAFILVNCLAHAETNTFAARAEAAFAEGQQAARQQPSNVVVLVQLARSAFDWAEFAGSHDQRAEIAERGIETARRVIDRTPTNAAAHYWLGMNLGQLARTKTLGALKLVREMEEEFLRARALDEHVDYAGPDRSLGMLYRDAPGWPTSIGSKKKAREHLERAVRLHPEFPDNPLGLAESYLEWGDQRSFQQTLKTAERVLADAAAKFTGKQWETSWADWRKRLAVLKSKSGLNRPVNTKGA